MMSRIHMFIRDLKRRHVFRTAAVYAVVAFMVAQAADLLMPGLLLPEWTYRLVVFLLVLGFPVAIVLSWAYDITPAGVRRAGDAEAAPGPLATSPAPATAPAPDVTSTPDVGPARGRAVGWAGVGILIGLVGFGGYAYLGPGSGRSSFPAEPAGAVRHVIAVLPFTNLAGGEENEYFADGITEDLLMNLGLVPEFAVISRTSVMRYKGTDKSIPEIAAELGAGYVLEGSLRRMGEQVRVVVQLIEPGTDTPVWASSLNRRIDDVFAIQAEIATAVVDALKIELAGGVSERIERAPTTDPVAYDLFLRAREEMRRGTAAAVEAGMDLHRQAIEQDPDFALGHAALGAAYALHYFNYGVDRSLLQAAFESARRALALQPDLADGHRALGTAFLSSGRFAEAIPALETAIELNPSDASAMNNLGLAYGMTGAWDRALAVARRALPHDPAQDHVVRTNMGNYYRIMGMYDRARVEVDRSYQSRPDYWVTPYALAWLDVVGGRPEAAVDPLIDLAAAQPHPRILAGIAWVLLLAGAEAEATPLLEQVMDVAPDMPGRFNPDPSVLFAYVVRQAGDTDRALQILDAAERRVREIMAAGDATPSYPYSLAAAAVIRGDQDAALDWLETAVERGWTQPATTRRDPVLVPLRSEPRFAAALATMDARVAAMRERVELEGL
jgi:TolB-like protein/Tfp pilus assembly protein PilF